MKIIIDIDTNNSAFWSSYETDKFEYPEVERILKGILPRIEKNNFGYSQDINGNTVARFTVERKDYEIPAS